MLLSVDDDTTGYGRRKATMTDIRVYASPNKFLPITANDVRVVLKKHIGIELHIVIRKGKISSISAD